MHYSSRTLYLCIISISFKYIFSILQRTFAKDGELYLNSCVDREELYVGNDPLLWPSCGDALEYTWTLDLYNELIGVSPLDKLKLIRSNGYCPQFRCQLGNISNADQAGHCPAGLCYTKLEYGAPSFGACCFVNNSFNSNKIIGYYDKLQLTPKPIYKTNRIVLGDDPLSESYEAFINANEIFPNIISTQCPLFGYPKDHVNTLNDMKRMIIEQNISLWISLAPSITPTKPCNSTCNSYNNFRAEMEYMLEKNQSNCNAFPLLLLQEYSGQIESNTFTLDNKSENIYLNLSYTLTAYYVRSSKGTEVLQFEQPLDHDNWRVVTRHVEHIWYLRWTDFLLPPVQDDSFMWQLAHYTASHIHQGGRIAINCLSGRGRSGTIAAIIASVARNAGTISEVVDLIVGMRRSRDGLVETPAQFRYIIQLLGLGDTATCNTLCLILSSFLSVNSFYAYGLGLFCCCCAILIIFLVQMRIRRIANTAKTRRD